MLTAVLAGAILGADQHGIYAMEARSSIRQAMTLAGAAIHPEARQGLAGMAVPVNVTVVANTLNALGFALADLAHPNLRTHCTRSIKLDLHTDALDAPAKEPVPP